MDSRIVGTADEFVGLVLKYNHWSEVKTLPDDEVKILFDTIFEAGFEIGKIEPGKLKGHHLEQDGGRTGERFAINNLCPFKVVNEEGNDHDFATGWLDCALRRVVSCSIHGDSQESLVTTIAQEIERSIPLVPIILTSQGDVLCENPRRPTDLNHSYFVEHTRDDNVLGLPVGIHKYCRGYMDRKRTTADHDVIVCRACHLRSHYFPKQIKTYGELRAWLRAL